MHHQHSHPKTPLSIRSDHVTPSTRELSILNAIAAALNASVDIDASLRAALSNVAELLGLRTGWVFLLDEETGEPCLPAAQELPPGLVSQPERMTGSCYCLDTYRAGDLGGAANVNVVRCSRLAGLLGENVAGDRSAPETADGARAFLNVRPALSCQHSAVRAGPAPGHPERRESRLARALLGGPAAPLHGGRPPRDRDRALPPLRAQRRARRDARAEPDRARDP